MPLKVKILLPLFTIFMISKSNAEVIRYTTWNLQWLATQPHKKMTSSNRDKNDIQLLREYFTNTASDVIAFQEVNDIDIITKVVGSDYQAILSHRSKAKNRSHQFSELNQYTGFAVKKTFKVKDHKDIKLDKRPKSKLRFASYIELKASSNVSIHLLSVHLKAGCRIRFQNKKNCRVLKEQLININLWIQEREKHQQAYIILGDFNSQFTGEAKWAWRLISQKTQAVLASQETISKCYVRSKANRKTLFKYENIIDHIIIDPSQTFSSAKQVPFNNDDVRQYKLSDHCPITIETFYLPY